MTQQPPEFTTVGQAAAILQRHPARIRAALVELGIAPALRINSLDCFSTEAIERLGRHFASQPQSRLVTRPAIGLTTRGAASQNGEDQ